VSRHRTNRALRLDLLRARAAADRVELALTLQGISERVAPLRRIVESIGSAAGVLRGRGRALSWIAAALAVLAQVRWLRQVVAGWAARPRSRPAWRSTLATVALLAAVVGMIIRRTRR